MNPTGPSGCLGDALLQRLCQDELSHKELEIAAAHIEHCADCQNRLDRLAGAGEVMPTDGGPEITPLPASLRKLMNELGNLPASADSPAPDAREIEQNVLTPPVRPGSIGRFGAYDVLERIASGGMGIVFKAHDPALNRIVAVKVLAPSLAASESARSRFLREARAAAAVVHENVVAIHAVGEERGLPYLVMQFVQGKSLQARLARGPLELKEILRIGYQTAAGLAAAHAQGLIHRDVKPGNILLENSVERVKLTDFGLARAVDEPGVTRPGMIAGTPEYMAPEQARGERIDARADLFSLGSVLYALATGHSPFASDSLLGSLKKVVDFAPPAPHDVNGMIPAWLGTIIMRLLAKEPGARVQTAGEVTRLLGDCLAALQSGRPISDIVATRPELVREARQAPGLGRWVLAAVAVSGIAAAAAWWYWPQPEKALPAPPAIATAPSATFHVTAVGGSTKAPFSSLEAAVVAASPGAIIEVASSGPIACGPITTQGKPLRIRAALESSPVLVRTNDQLPLIAADALLVLEGLELRTHQADSDLSRQPLGGRQPRLDSVLAFAGTNAGSRFRHPLVITSGAPLYLSHCRFVGASVALPGQELVRLEDVPEGRIQHSEFYQTGGSALAWSRSPMGQNAARTAALRLENITVLAREGLLFQLGGRGMTQLECVQSTFVGAQAFGVVGQGAASTEALRNVFDVVWVARRRTADPGMPLPRTWQGTTNFYSLIRPPRGQGGARLRPTEAEFAKSMAFVDRGSMMGEAGIAMRLGSKAGPDQRLSPADFRLNAEHLSTTPPASPELLSELGAAVDTVGPNAYRTWRQSPAYATWVADTSPKRP